METRKEKRTEKAELSWLEDPRVFAVNRLDAHSDHSFYPSMEAYRQGREALKQSLNGEWRLCWSPSPKFRPKDFMVPGYDLSSFDTVMVPGHLELAGYGQIQYTNTAYPWDGHRFLRPPFIDWEDNPVASYVREFDLDEELLRKRVCLSFQGAEEAIYVWLNGTFVGYAEDSFTPSDFDVTELVRAEGNRLCVELYKRSSAAWIEDQDFFCFSGLFREVFLYGKPEGHVEDLKLLADYHVKEQSGVFSFQADISGEEWSKVLWELTDEEGVLVGHGEIDSIPEGAMRRISSSPVEVPKIHPWDAGDPYLYQLLIKVVDGQGEILEVVPYEVGFRCFEIRDCVMLLNGKRLLVNGVNRHEWSPRTGRSITEEEMRRDIEIMKANGINAVRTSHYPNQSLWYRLCDKAGICVMDETNLESHGSCMKLGVTEVSWNVPGSDESWLSCCLDRAKSMYERDKNHPSILWWSAGNESHVGMVIQRMCEFFHRVDSTRLVHYEAVFYDRSFDFITDVESRMYPTPEKVREYLEDNPKKPMVLCEYMHDMGNSLGGLESYMKLREEFDSFHGGFLWDLIDQALYLRDEDGNLTSRLGYGGDFLERPTDYAFCANGLLSADRKEKPAMEEVRYWYLPKKERMAFDLENAEARKACKKRVEEELKKLSGSSPDEKSSLYHVPAGPRGSSGSLKEDCAFVDTGGPFLKVAHTDFNLGLSGEGFHYMFSFDKGGPVSLLIQGKEQLYRAPRPTFWRAPTENDMGCGFPNQSAQWLGADQYSQAGECMVEEFGDNFAETLVPLNFAERKAAREDIREVEIRYTYTTATVPATEVVVSYRVNAYGRMKVSLSYKGNPSLPQLPVFGLRMQTALPIPSYTWEGLSGETYPDRYRGASFGTHTETPGIPVYLVPQECGNHKDTFRLEAGDLVFLMCEEPFHFSILPYTQQELEAASHREELPESSRSTISILGAIRGVGGIDSWENDVEEAYHISGQEDLEFSFYLAPKLR